MSRPRQLVEQLIRWVRHVHAYRPAHQLNRRLRSHEQIPVRRHEPCRVYPPPAAGARHSIEDRINAGITPASWWGDAEPS